MVQPTLVQISEPENILEPSNEGQLQLYFNKELAILSAKVKGGLSTPISIIIPDSKGITTDGVPTEIPANSIFTPLQTRIKIPLNTTIFYSYFVLATRTGGVAPGAVGASGITQLQFLVRNLAGVVTIVVTSGPNFLTTGDAEAAAWSTDVTVSGDELVHTVTGEAGKIIEWEARIAQLSSLQFTL